MTDDYLLNHAIKQGIVFASFQLIAKSYELSSAKNIMPVQWPEMCGAHSVFAECVGFPGGAVQTRCCLRS